MNENAREVKRPYRQTERAQRALATRAKIRSAAAALFVAHGYASTTMKQIATDAGIGERTLYDAFPTKVDLYEYVVGVAIAGDEQPLTVAERSEFQRAITAADVDGAITAFVDQAADLLERAGPLIMVAVESSGADPAMRSFADRGATATRDNAEVFVNHLATMHSMRPDAVDSLFALISPHVHQMLRRDADFTADEYRRWLARAVAAFALEATD